MEPNYHGCKCRVAASLGPGASSFNRNVIRESLITGARKRTVQKHAEHIFAKLGVENRASAILRVVELRLGLAGPAA